MEDTTILPVSPVLTPSVITVSDEEMLPAQGHVDYRSTWRIFRIMAELVEGYEFLSSLEREVTILGSARFPSSHRYYRLARAMGRSLADNGLTTITGGGPGVMEAANRGAFDAGGESIGLNIQLPMEQRINPYVKRSIAFYYFFTRKVMLTSPANAFIYFPGGYGTMDEFFEVVDLMELGLMGKVPIILMGTEFWQPLLDFLRTSASMIGSVKGHEVDEWHLVDTVEEAEPHLKAVKDIKNICELSPNSFHCEGKIDWKIFRVMSELVEGFDFVSGLSHAVTILGTKSITSDDPYYHAVAELGRNLAEQGYTVVTGGRSGIAEAANKGSFEVGGQSVGIGMKMGSGAVGLNKYLTKSILFDFPFTRKLIITTPTSAFIFFPGGFGTLHQLFEVLTLMQTKKIKRRPVILYDHAFWGPLHTFIKKILVHDVKTVGPEDDELYQIVDSVESVMEVINAGSYGRPIIGN